MKKFVAGVVLGVLVGALVMWSVHGGYACGRYHGRLDGLGEAMEALRTEYGEVASSEAESSLFHLKTSAAVVVVVDGVKTVRVVP